MIDGFIKCDGRKVGLTRSLLRMLLDNVSGLPEYLRRPPRLPFRGTDYDGRTRT